jgi:hypothetical protein
MLGADSYSMNCVRHFASRTQPRLRHVFYRTPDRLLARAIRRIERGALSRFWFSAYVSALARRPSFLRERVGQARSPHRADPLGRSASASEWLSYGPGDTRALRHQCWKAPTRTKTRRRSGASGWLHRHPARAQGSRCLDSRRSRTVATLLSSPSRVRTNGRVLGLRSTAAPAGRWRGADRILRHVSTGTAGDTIAAARCPRRPVGVVRKYATRSIFRTSAACPIVASNVPGLAEVVQHNENGLLFEPGDSRGLAAALEQLVQQPGLLSRLSSRAPLPRPIGDYVTSLIDIYGEVMRERGRKR